MSDLKIRFGRRLRKLRRNMDLTQEQLAERCGVSADFISQVERGINTPSFATIQKLAEILEVDPSELFLPPDKK